MIKRESLQLKVCKKVAIYLPNQPQELVSVGSLSKLIFYFCWQPEPIETQNWLHELKSQKEQDFQATNIPANEAGSPLKEISTYSEQQRETAKHREICLSPLTQTQSEKRCDKKYEPKQFLEVHLQVRKLRKALQGCDLISGKIKLLHEKKIV